MEISHAWKNDKPICSGGRTIDSRSQVIFSRAHNNDESKFNKLLHETCNRISLDSTVTIAQQSREDHQETKMLNPGYARLNPHSFSLAAV